MFGIFGRRKKRNPGGLSGGRRDGSSGGPPGPAHAPATDARKIREARKFVDDTNLQDRVLVDDRGGLHAIEGTDAMFLQPLREMLATSAGEANVAFLAPHVFRQKVQSRAQPRKKSGSETVRAARQANLAVDHVLGLAIDARASDFYLDIRNLDDVAILSIRTYGLVREIERMTAQAGKEIATGLFSRSENDSWEDITPSDTSFSHWHAGKLYRVRANSLPEVRGAALSCRIRDPQFVLPLGEAGYNPRQQGYITRMCRSPGGLILITGETNSGKSTTLASLMKDTPRGQRMIEIADPVEVEFPNVTHCEIDHRREDPEAFFARVLASTVRQNPDALVLGEIRDERTARAAQNMAIQGKRVFSTLHTQSCVAAIPRLTNLGIDPHLLTLREFIAGIVNQNLVPLVCPDCCRGEPADPALSDRYRALFGDAARYVNPDGCGPGNPGCVGGVVGQTLVAEVLPLGLDREEAHQLIAGNRLWELQNYMQRKFSVQTKQEHARDKVLSGLIDPELTEAIIGEWSAGVRESQAVPVSGGAS